MSRIFLSVLLMLLIYTSAFSDTLPVPHQTPAIAKQLSLREAIVLALRNNPNVRIAELQRIVDKFNLELVLQSYRIQWEPLTATAQSQFDSPPQFSAGGGINLNAPSGTSVSLGYKNNLLGGTGVANASITQHLLKGFGFAVNRVNYQNGINTESINRLNFKNSVINTIVQVTTAYRNLVGSYNSLDTSKQSLVMQSQEITQSQLQVKVGQMAPSDLLAQQTNIETARLNVVQQENALRDAYFSFLTSLGLEPSTRITIDRKILLNNRPIPTVQHCIQLALLNNVAYQQSLLQLKITKRALITQENARKWTLDLTGGITDGITQTPGGLPESINGSPMVQLSLSVPIDNIQNKSNVVSAKVAIQDAQLNLAQQKQTLMSQVMDEYAAIQNQSQQIQISQKQVHLQQHTLNDSKLKLKYGQTSVFEVNSYTNQLLSQQVALINEKIQYLSDVTALYATLGVTLDRWDIRLRY